MRDDGERSGHRRGDARALARRRMRALGDAALVAAMGAADPWAWGEFYRRFHPGLAAYAVRIGVADADRDACIDEVLEDVAARLADGTLAPPEHLNAYLLRAVRNRAMRVARAAGRERRHVEAAGLCDDERVAQSLCSEASRRASRDVWREPGANAAAGPDGALGRLVRALEAQLSDDERRILGWIADALSHREIAELLGVSYDAATKRVWRLQRRLRGAALLHAAAQPAAEQVELRRFFRRARGTEATTRDAP